ncbi:MAG: UDP-N-acetylglucosamine 2-epimerase (non-hydrolyzing) [Flavobacteriales bacterium]|nr:UDP-N-acetylglucosamine 2-epimerase (non-hydrolyzing) [Flavobacteriales bacterium]
MIKLITVIGARPQFIKAAAISRAIGLAYSDQIKEKIVHTGQHYDENMSNVFFKEMKIPRPDYNLKVGSSTHGRQTASMIKGLEDILVKEKPDGVLTYGDTNSTLSAAVTASKLHIPVIHVEAGLRSFNKRMPEEINRIVCDHVATLLFTPTEAGYYNLIQEGFKENSEPPYSIDRPKIYHCGDIMYDNSLHFAELARTSSTLIHEDGIDKDNFALVTIHRDNNTDDPKRLSALFDAIYTIAENHEIQMVIPMHPRTAKLLKKNLDAKIYKAISKSDRIKLLPAVSYVDMISLEMNCKMVLTDSGGVQKEAYFYKKPTIIMRSETEWVELVHNGNAIVADADKERIIEAYEVLSNKTDFTHPLFYGDGKAAMFICDEIVKTLSAKDS